MFGGMPYIAIFLGVLGFGLFILFCTTFCRMCSRFREEQIEREVWRRSEQSGHPHNIYVIPFPRNLSQQDIADQHGGELNADFHTSPPYNYFGPPPSYNELGFKFDELPPAYTEHNFPGCPSPPTPPPLPPTDTAQSQP